MLSPCLFPHFWTVLFALGLALTVLALAANHPERLAGWGGAGLAARFPALAPLLAEAGR